MDEEPPLPPPPPPFKESDIPIFSTHITLSRDTHNIWTRGRTFNRQSYFTVLTALQALEAKMKKCRTPELYEREERKMRQAFEYLEKLVLEYLFSDEAEDDWEKFELLRNPDHTTKNERMRRALEARLEETKEELRTKEVMIDLRTWRRNETIVSIAIRIFLVGVLWWYADLALRV